MRLITLLCFVALLVQPLLRAQRPDSGETTAFRGILVAASKSAGATDPQLKPFEANLRRILRFDRFRFLGEGRTSLGAPARGTLMLGQGHQLNLQTEPSSDGSVRVQVTWSDRDETLIRTGLVLRPGVPAVLAGPARGEDEVFAVIVVAN